MKSDVSTLFLESIELAIHHFQNGREDLSQLSLTGAFEYLIKSSALRDQFSYTSYHHDAWLVSTEAKSQKQYHDYTLFICGYNTINLKTAIYEPSMLRSMKPEYWSLLAQLDEMKCFKFQENSGITKEINFNQKSVGSAVYDMIKNFVILEEHCDFGSNDLGFLEAEWSINLIDDSLFDEMKTVLKGIHRLNYFMYRLEQRRRNDV